MTGLYKKTVIGILVLLLGSQAFAGDFNIDGDVNKSIIRFEIDNDTVWDMDSNFTNGWSIQYHTPLYKGWDDVNAPGLVKWVGQHIPGLDLKKSFVRNGYGLGQNMITPGDLRVAVPQDGDLPYAGTLTLSSNWQNFTCDNARTFQFTVGLLGKEAGAENLQKFVHNDLDIADDPKGWDTQRKTEPILNIGYLYTRRLAYFGQYTDNWAGQLDMDANASLGNLDTSTEMGASFRFGWNIPQGFASAPAPPGVGVFQAAYLPKPAGASPHGFEVVLGISVTALLYSVLYDGSILTSDDRDVERENFMVSGILGVNYHYYERFSIHLYFAASTDLLKEEELPAPQPGREKTHGDLSYGAFMIDFYF